MVLFPRAASLNATVRKGLSPSIWPLSGSTTASPSKFKCSVWWPHSGLSFWKRVCVSRVQVRDREIKVNIFDMAGHPFFYEVSFEPNLCLLSSLMLTVSRSFLHLRYGTSSTRTARVCCWCTTWASGRVSMPSTAGWERWSRKWVLRPIWKASSSSSAPTRSDWGLCVGHRWSCETKPPPGGDKFDGSCVHGVHGLKRLNHHMSSQVDLTKRRVVDEGEGRLWAESRGFHYFETSAQSGEGINEMFQVCFCAKQEITHTHTHTQLHVPRFLSPSFHPSLTCVRTAGSVRWPRSAWASPKSRPTPFAASATAKTPGTCWASSLVPHGEPGFRGWVPGVRGRSWGQGLGPRVSLLLFTFAVFGACFQGGSEQSVQEAGRAAAPWQVRRPRQRRCLQGCGERSHLTAEEH